MNEYIQEYTFPSKLDSEKAENIISHFQVKSFTIAVMKDMMQRNVTPKRAQILI